MSTKLIPENLEDFEMINEFEKFKKNYIQDMQLKSLIDVPAFAAGCRA